MRYNLLLQIDGRSAVKSTFGLPDQTPERLEEVYTDNTKAAGISGHNMDLTRNSKTNAKPTSNNTEKGKSCFIVALWFCMGLQSYSFDLLIQKSISSKLNFKTVRRM